MIAQMMAAQRAAARGSKRRLADAAAQRAERHETVGGHGRQCLVAVGPEPLAGEARVPGLQVDDVAKGIGVGKGFEA